MMTNEGFWSKKVRESLKGKLLLQNCFRLSGTRVILTPVFLQF
jgi:hypothetical protein